MFNKYTQTNFRMYSSTCFILV